MKTGAYYARVTKDRVVTVFADEDAVRDAQMRQIFANRDKSIATHQRIAARKFRSMIKECLWLIGTAILVYCTYLWGVYAAVAAIAGCVVAVGCRIIHHIIIRSPPTLPRKGTDLTTH